MTNPSEWPIIPRKLLLGNAFRLDPRLSPDGGRLAWLAPVDGVMNIWVAVVDAISDAQPATRLGGRPVAWHDWSADGRYVIFFEDENGDENYNLFVVEPNSGEVRNLTPMPKVAARIFLLSPDLPDRVLIGLNDRDPSWHDVWSVDLTSGKRDLVYENTEKFGWFEPDWSGRIRVAGRSEPSKGGRQIYRMEAGRPEPWRFIPFDDTHGTGFYCFNRSGSHLLGLSSIDRDKAAVVRIDMATNEEVVLAEHRDASGLRNSLRSRSSGESSKEARRELRLSGQSLHAKRGVNWKKVELMHRIRKGQFGLGRLGVQGRLAPACGMPCSKLEVSTVQHGTLSGAGYLHQSHRKQVGQFRRRRHAISRSLSETDEPPKPAPAAPADGELWAQ